MYEENHNIYTRCSTDEQLKKGFSHEYQIRDIKSIVQGQCIGRFSDTITGKTFERSELDLLERSFLINQIQERPEGYYTLRQ